MIQERPAFALARYFDSSIPKLAGAMTDYLYFKGSDYLSSAIQIDTTGSWLVCCTQAVKLLKCRAAIRVDNYLVLKPSGYDICPWRFQPVKLGLDIVLHLRSIQSLQGSKILLRLSLPSAI